MRELTEKAAAARRRDKAASRLARSQRRVKDVFDSWGVQTIGALLIALVSLSISPFLFSLFMYLSPHTQLSSSLPRALARLLAPPSLS